jgi:SAM-dependent methyltransferase
MKAPCADCGEPNPYANLLANHYNLAIKAIDIDLDREAIPGKYNTIFCFEVLEHLYNPLFCLEQIYNALNETGILYLSIPYHIKLLWGKRHFHEIDDKRMFWLFDAAGFRIVKKDKISVRWELWKHFTGFRPLLRLFSKTRIYKLEKNI